MKFELGDRECTICEQRLYHGEWSHICGLHPSRGIDCSGCQKTIILYDHKNVSRNDFWSKYWCICQCEHEELNEKN